MAKHAAHPDVNRGAMAFALNFTLVTFFVLRQRIKHESFSLLFYFGVITEGPAASYNRHLAEKYKIALHILQLHRIKKQPDEDPMKKGARDGKACGIV